MSLVFCQRQDTRCTLGGRKKSVTTTRTTIIVAMNVWDSLALLRSLGWMKSRSEGRDRPRGPTSKCLFLEKVMDAKKIVAQCHVCTRKYYIHFIIGVHLFHPLCLIRTRDSFWWVGEHQLCCFYNLFTFDLSLEASEIICLYQIVKG